MDVIAHQWQITFLSTTTRMALIPVLMLFHFYYAKAMNSSYTNFVFLSLIFAFVGIWIAALIERSESWVAYGHLLFLVEAQLIIFAFRPHVKRISLSKLGIFPLIFIVFSSLVFFMLVIEKSSMAIELLLLIRVLQTGLIAAIGFILFKKNNLILLGAVLLGLSNFITGISFFYKAIPYEYALSIVCFYVGRFYLTKGYLDLSKQKMLNYISEYHLS